MSSKVWTLFGFLCTALSVFHNVFDRPELALRSAIAGLFIFAVGSIILAIENLKK